MRAQREEFIDALRGYALLGVFAVNFSSYSYGLNLSVIGLVEPADSTLARLAHGATGALFQAKSYPLLAFLVGYSLALTIRAAQRKLVPQAQALRQRRMRNFKQLGLGVAHGTLLYYGDILTAYALLTFVLIAWARLRLASLRRFVFVLALVLVALEALLLFYQVKRPDTSAQLIYDVGRLSLASHWAELLRINASMFANASHGLIAIVPMLLLPASVGLFAGRLRWLERPERWRRQWRVVAWSALPLGLVLNIAYGVVATSASVERDPTTIELGETLVTYTGLLLSAGVLAAAVSAYHHGYLSRLATLLAPLGRLSLSAYVAHSVAMQLLFGGPFLNLAPALGSAGLFGLAVAYWLVMIAIAHALERRGQRGPLETWMSRA